MAISVQWDNEARTIIRWDFEAEWSWDELADTARVSSAMIATREDDVDIILNASGTRAPNGKITPYQRSAFAYTPSNIRMLVLVCGRELEAVQVVSPFFPQLEIADDLEQARMLLELQPA